MSRNCDLVDITVQILRHGDNSMLVTDGDIEDWVPYSLLGEDSEVDETSDEGDTGDIYLPQWKAEEIGFV